MKESFNKSLTAPQGNQGFGLSDEEVAKEAVVKFNDGTEATMKTGALALQQLRPVPTHLTHMLC